MSIIPTRDDIAQAILARYLSFDPISAQGIADVVLAILPGRTEAEVKAEALREAADGTHLTDDFEMDTALGNADFTRAWLRDRADRIVPVVSTDTD